MKFALVILATYRAAQLIAVDDGPFEVFQRLRVWAGVRAHKNAAWKTFADLVYCPYCVGVWLAALLSMYLRPRNFIEWLVYWLATAGGQAALESLTTREV